MSTPMAEDVRRGSDAVAYRESRANVWRRRDRGETVETCADCGCEVDVAAPCHSRPCSQHGVRFGEEPLVVSVAVEPMLEPERPLFVGVASSAGFESSAARARERSAADDFDLEICAWCMCEVDVDEPAHRPGCPGIGKPRASEVSVLVIVPALPEREPEAHEEALLGGDPPPAIGASPVAVAVVEEPSGSENAAPRKSGRPKIWTVETISAWVVAFVEREQRVPTTFDLEGKGNPNWGAVRREFGSLKEAVEASGVRVPIPAAPEDVPATGEAHDAQLLDESGEAASASIPPTREPDAASIDLEAVRTAALHAVNAIFDLLAATEKACAR